MNKVLQPWTPCLPIRGGKLKTSKPISTSNPQLPFLCSTANSFVNNSNKNNSSSNSLNSSFIWREASPNNFNLYSTSISSLSTNYRCTSLSGNGSSPGAGNNIITTNQLNLNGRQLTGSPVWRSVSEEKPPVKPISGIRMNRTTNPHYENVFLSPLLPRKMKHMNPQSGSRIWKNSSAYQQLSNSGNTSGGGGGCHQYSLIQGQRNCQVSPSPQQILYDRRLNRSFETPQNCDEKLLPLRRSTPHLAGDELYGNDGGASSRHSATWCCGNFVLKQLKKMNNFNT